MTNKAKAKGTLFETEVLKYLRGMGVEADKLRQTGAKDEGDIVAKIGGLPFVFENKACERLNLAGWVGEASLEATHYAVARGIVIPHFAVIHKKRGAPIAEAYVTLPLYEYVRQISPPF